MQWFLTFQKHSTESPITSKTSPLWNPWHIIKMDQYIYNMSIPASGSSGKSSDLVPITSGVPQETVLGPLLFLTFINELPTGITSNLRLFVDDCLVYRSISCTADSLSLQEDLDRLPKWSNVWQMKFNIDKCHTMRIILHRNTINTEYHLGGNTLSMVSQYPYLGVTMSNTMSWQNHINGITARANKMLDLITRNLRGTSQKLRQQAYISLVHPHLEYCCTVWNPYTKELDN